jgi:hypothetical protein
METHSQLLCSSTTYFLQVNYVSAYRLELEDHRSKIPSQVLNLFHQRYPLGYQFTWYILSNQLRHYIVNTDHWDYYQHTAYQQHIQRHPTRCPKRWKRLMLLFHLESNQLVVQFHFRSKSLNLF